MRPALEHPNVTLLTNAQAVKLETNEAGTAVTEVVVDRDGAEERYAGDVVVLACGAANTAKLLLDLGERQASERARERLRPGRAQLHVPQQPGRARAVARGEPDDLPEDAGPERLLLQSGRRRLPAREHPDGRQVAGADVPRREAGRDEARAAAGRSSGSPGTRSTSGSRPRICRAPENRVTVDRDGKVTLAYTATNDVPKERLYAKLKSLLGMLDLNPDHLFSPLRLPEERDPGRGRRPPGGHVPLRRRPGRLGAERDCRAHEVDNLYVVDTSIFPSIGAVNPALTAMANSLRVGDHLLARIA